MRKIALARDMKISYPAGVNAVERMTEAQSARLIAECLAGNEEAIEVLVRQYETGVFRLALSVLGDAAEASEVTQETFLSALRSLKSYQERKSLKAWLYTIALNHSRSHLRKRKIRERLRSTLTRLFQLETERPVLPEEALIQNEKEAALWKALNQLEERWRTVIVLRYFHELSVAEISEILSPNEGTVHSRLHTARERLRKALKAAAGE